MEMLLWQKKDSALSVELTCRLMRRKAFVRNAL